MENMKYNEKPVEITNTEDWKYDGVSCEKLKELNEELYNDIQIEVNNYVENYEKIQAEKAAEEQRKLIESRQAKFDEFKNIVNAVIKNSKKEYVVKFKDENVREVDIDDSTIEYNDEVWPQDSWRAQKTSRVWLTTHNWKSLRYADLKTAVEKLLEKIDEAKDEKARENKKTYEREQEQIAVKKFCEENDLEYKYEYSKWGGKIHLGKMDDIVVYLHLRDGEVKIYKTVINRVMTIEDVKKLQRGKNE